MYVKNHICHKQWRYFINSQLHLMPGSSKCLKLLLGGVKQATEGHKTRLPPTSPLKVVCLNFTINHQWPLTSYRAPREQGNQGQLLTHGITHASSSICETFARRSDQSIRWQDTARCGQVSIKHARSFASSFWCRNDYESSIPLIYGFHKVKPCQAKPKCQPFLF